jgi:heptosyltransferase-1
MACQRNEALGNGREPSTRAGAGYNARVFSGHRMSSIDVRKGDGILLIRLGAVGDVIRTLPALSVLRQSFPETRLCWVVEPGCRSLLPGPPWLDEIIVFPRAAFKSGWSPRSLAGIQASLRDFFSRLRSFNPDLSIDFQGSAKSALLGRLSGASHRLGFDRTGSREGSHLLNRLRVKPSSAHLNRVWKNLELLAPLQVKPSDLHFPFPPLPHSAKVSAFFASLGPAIPVALHPGTSDRQAHKRWPSEDFGILAQLLAREGYAPILTWGPGEESLAAEVLGLSRGTAVLAPATSLCEMRELLLSCKLFVGGDTGPMHLAWTQGVPVVALFGSTDPRINGPLGDRHRVLAPAWESGSGPRRGDPDAIKRISPDSVMRASREILSSIPLPTAGMGGP